MEHTDTRGNTQVLGNEPDGTHRHTWQYWGAVTLLS